MATKDFQVQIQHNGQKPFRNSFASPDTARGWVRPAVNAGADIARVVRVTDNVVIFDPTNGVDVPYELAYLPVDQWPEEVPVVVASEFPPPIASAVGPTSLEIGNAGGLSLP